jgi:hypothetical protein
MQTKQHKQKKRTTATPHGGKTHIGATEHTDRRDVILWSLLLNLHNVILIVKNTTSADYIIYVDAGFVVAGLGNEGWRPAVNLPIKKQPAQLCTSFNE